MYRSDNQFEFVTGRHVTLIPRNWMKNAVCKYYEKLNAARRNTRMWCYLICVVRGSDMQEARPLHVNDVDVLSNYIVIAYRFQFPAKFQWLNTLHWALFIHFRIYVCCLMAPIATSNLLPSLRKLTLFSSKNFLPNIQSRELLLKIYFSDLLKVKLLCSEKNSNWTSLLKAILSRYSGGTPMFRNLLSNTAPIVLLCISLFILTFFNLIPKNK